MRYERAFYLFHPDFIQDENGYKILDTGKWVLEFDTEENGIKKHSKIAFQNERDCRTAWQKIMHKVDKSKIEYMKGTSYMRQKVYRDMIKTNEHKKHLGI